MELMRASHQYYTRPDDERYKSLEDMQAVALEQRRLSQSIKVPSSVSLTVGVDSMEEELFVEDSAGNGCFTLNNWSFGQLCSRVKAPADYLIGLDDPELVAECLNRGLMSRRKSDAERKTKGLQIFHCEGTLRALTSRVYSRIYDTDILKHLIPLREEGWKTPPAWGSPDEPGSWQATKKDVCNFSLVNEGDWIRPSGLYRGDRDMFVFMVNDGSRIDDGTDEGLGRGFFVSNSEVGAASFSFMDFLYRYVCGNHIVWGAQNVQEVRLRHVGGDTPEKAFDALQATLIEYADMSAEHDELLIKRAKKFILGDSKEEVLEFLFTKHLTSKKLAEESYNLCEEFEPALNPRSAWGVIQGITRASQEESFANKRNKIDAITPKILAYAAE